MREFGGPEVLRVEDVPRPTPGPGEVLVQVRAVSVNRTLDLRVRSGRYERGATLPHVLGADPSGVIAEVGPHVRRGIGERVTVSSHVRCGTCGYCRAGEEANCTGSESIGVQGRGGYAGDVAVAERNAYANADSHALPQAAPIGRQLPPPV